MVSGYDMGIFDLRRWLILLLFVSGCVTAPLTQTPLKQAEFAQGEHATVLFWWATECPCVKRYQSRMEAMAAHYEPLGVRFYAIASNSDDSLDAVHRVAHERNFKLTLLKDEGAQLANTYGARTTPTVVILDKEGAVRFRGWIDNERFQGDPHRNAYAENALDEVLKGEEVTQPSSPIFGCRITTRL